MEKRTELVDGARDWSERLTRSIHQGNGLYACAVRVARQLDCLGWKGASQVCDGFADLRGHPDVGMWPALGAKLSHGRLNPRPSLLRWRRRCRSPKVRYHWAWPG